MGDNTFVYIIAMVLWTPVMIYVFVQGIYERRTDNLDKEILDRLANSKRTPTDTQGLYRIEGYVRAARLVHGRGVTATKIVYYDYLAKKHAVVSKWIENKEIDKYEIEEGVYTGILVKEKSGKLKYKRLG